MFHSLLIGFGAAGNKAVCAAVGEGVIDIDDTILVNSTSKDFPKDYEGKKIILSGLYRHITTSHLTLLYYYRTLLETTLLIP